MRNFNRILLAVLTVFSFMVFLPAFAGEKANKSEASCCVTDCASCARTCEDTLAYCREKGGKHASAEHIKILEDCAAMCKLSSDFSKRGSVFAPKVRAICAEICKKCAESCAAFKDDKKMQDCASACNECSTTCSK